MNEERTFGIEMETLCKNPRQWVAEQLNVVLQPFGHTASAQPYHHGTNSRNLTHWEVKPDGSVSQGATPEYRYDAEIVTPVLKGNEGLQVLKAVCTWLVSSHAFKVSKVCGLHVHHGVSARELNALAKTWVKIEGVVMNCLPGSRKGNRYCKPWKNRYARGSETMLEELGAMQWYSRYLFNDRYYNLNFASYSMRGTVEFRCAAGSFEYEKISQWLLCTQAIIEASKLSVPAETFTEVSQLATWLNVGNVVRRTENGNGNVATVFGNHKRGSASAKVDEMLARGIHLHEAVAELQTTFANYANAPKTALRKFKGHVLHLVQQNVNVVRIGTYYKVETGTATETVVETIENPYAQAIQWLQARYAQFVHVAPIYN